jgi:ArsR family transcriptional regulator
MPAPSAALKRQATIFKALGHPVRLLMVQELAAGERCVCDLTALAKLDMSTVSKHLALLVAAGVLTSDKRATKVFYRLRTPCVATVLSCLDTVAPATPKGSACCR